MGMLKAIYIKNCIKRAKQAKLIGAKMSRSLNTKMKRKTIKKGM